MQKWSKTMVALSSELSIQDRAIRRDKAAEDRILLAHIVGFAKSLRQVCSENPIEEKAGRQHGKNNAT
jgi:hypothetical protein